MDRLMLHSVIAPLLAGMLSVCAHPSNTAAEHRLPAEFEHALRRTETYFAEVTAHGTLHHRKIRPHSPPENSVSEYLFQRSGGASKWHVRAPVREGDYALLTVWCRNPARYAFEAESFAGESRFFVTQIAPKDAPSFDSTERYAYRYFDASHAVLGVALSEIISHPTFAIRSLHFVDDGPERLVHVQYALSPDEPLILRSGELWLLPDQGWAVRRSRTEFMFRNQVWTAGEATTTVTYDGLDNGVALPTQVRITQRFGEFMETEETFAFDGFEHTASPPEVFTLSHYKIPEVEAARILDVSYEAAPSARLVLFANAAALVCVIGLVVVRRRMRRASGARM